MSIVVYPFIWFRSQRNTIWHWVRSVTAVVHTVTRGEKDDQELKSEWRERERNLPSMRKTVRILSCRVPLTWALSKKSLISSVKKLRGKNGLNENCGGKNVEHWDIWFTGMAVNWLYCYSIGCSVLKALLHSLSHFCLCHCLHFCLSFPVCHYSLWTPWLLLHYTLPGFIYCFFVCNAKVATTISHQ